MRSPTEAPRAGPRIGLDMQLAIGTATGIGEYVRGLAAALVERGVAVAPLAFAGLDPWRFDRRVLWDQAGLPLAARRARVELLHCAAGTLPLVASVPLVATVHDVAWLRVQSHTRPYARAYFGGFQLARYARARAIFVDSAFSRAELLAVAPLDPARVVVLYPGVASDVMTVERSPAAQPFVLAVGTVEPRKNLEVLVRALVAVPALRLVSVGPFTPYRERVLSLARDLGVRERVELRGYVERSEVLSLYARATLACVPSHYEGFGYGAAQALCAGVPLVAADAASLPEIVAGAAPLAPPDDVASWVERIRTVLADRDAADRRAALGRATARVRFAWTAGAETALTTYRRVLLEDGR